MIIKAFMEGSLAPSDYCMVPMSLKVPGFLMGKQKLGGSVDIIAVRVSYFHCNVPRFVVTAGPEWTLEIGGLLLIFLAAADAPQPLAGRDCSSVTS
ncbi:MAG: hypothetical protein WB762_10615 [Candidatus Sulfotelmatobacter sp.]